MGRVGLVGSAAPCLILISYNSIVAVSLPSKVARAFSWNGCVSNQMAIFEHGARID